MLQIERGGSITKRIFVIVSISLFLIIPGCFKKGVEVVEPGLEKKGYSDITSQELMQKIRNKERFLLLDVRSKEKYEQAHLKGALLIPHTEIESRHGELGCRCREIVVYDRLGRRSVTASKALAKLGFGRVKNLLGGIKAWKKAGGEIVIGGIHAR